MRGALRAADGVDAAVHHGHPDPVPGDVERGPLAPLVGHRVVAAQGTGLRVVLRRQVPPSDLDFWTKKEGLERRLCLNLFKLSKQTVVCSGVAGRRRHEKKKVGQNRKYASTDSNTRLKQHSTV